MFHLVVHSSNIAIQQQRAGHNAFIMDLKVHNMRCTFKNEVPLLSCFAYSVAIMLYAIRFLNHILLQNICNFDHSQD